ncbi:hypothetical protein [Thalassobacillus devorans]|uniref:hypothetical protein n=1 Tax=Thalassobacillus devorans TaxID=279813 RepID=UPI0004921E40|nr:hypothetical protein [Thalassobacillus devorans]
MQTTRQGNLLELSSYFNPIFKQRKSHAAICAWLYFIQGGDIPVKHPYEKLQRLQVLCMVLSIVLAIVALAQQAFSWTVLVMFYMLALSFMFEGMVELQKRNTFHFVSQVIRALLIAIFSTLLFF